MDGGKGAERLMYRLAGVPTQGDRHGWGAFENPAPHHQIGRVRER